MKKIFSVLLCLAICIILVAPAHAANVVASGKCGNNVTWTLDQEGVLVISGKGEMEDYVVGVEYYGDKMSFYTHYKDPEWNQLLKGVNVSIKSVRIEDGVTSVGGGAFSGWASLEEVYLANSVVSIGDEAFAGCSLKKVIFPSNLAYIGAGAFDRCQIEHVTIPSGTKHIGVRAFAPDLPPYPGTINGKNIVVDPSNQYFVSIDGVVYSKDLAQVVFCSSGFSGECVLAQGVKAIGDYAFFRVDGLTSLVLPDGVVSLGNYAIYRCNNLKTVYIPASLKDTKWPGGTTLSGAFSDIYYGGSEGQWKALWKDNTGYYGDRVFDCNVHYNVPMALEDVPSAWAKTEVEAAINSGLVPDYMQKGYAQPISRVEAANLFVRLIERCYGKNVDEIMAEKQVVVNAAVFSDTTDKGVLAANALGVLYGVGDGRFSPGSTLTRSQVAAIVNRVAKVMGINTDGYSHNFVDVRGHWVDPELGWPYQMDIINGVGQNRFDPESKLTVEQAIAVSYRAFQVLK